MGEGEGAGNGDDGGKDDPQTQIPNLHQPSPMVGPGGDCGSKRGLEAIGGDGDLRWQTGPEEGRDGDQATPACDGVDESGAETCGEEEDVKLPIHGGRIERRVLG